MIWIVGIIALFVVLSLSLIVVRLATVALTMTGLSSQAASFQAHSAFTGTGFTTSEAEQVVDHPVRRRIVNWLMLLQSARFFGNRRRNSGSRYVRSGTTTASVPHRDHAPDDAGYPMNVERGADSSSAPHVVTS